MLNYSKIAKYAFFILLFFTFWGTSLPFSGRGVGRETSSSIINQLLYGGLFITSVISLLPRKDEFLSIIKNEKFLSIFIVFAVMSILWSDYSLLTFKRIFRIVAMVLTCISFLLYVDSSEEILKPFKYVLYPYLLLTIIVVLVIPEAKDPQFHTWRGFTTQKNSLGQIGYIAVILCYIFYKGENSERSKTIAAFMLFLSIILLVGSFSSTSLIILIFLFGLAVLLSLDVFFKPIRIGRTISFITISFFAIFVIGLITLIPELETILPGLFGKDITFSGRTILWEYLLTEIKFNHILGNGYQAFWVHESKIIILINETFYSPFNQAHNGYIDILLQSGYIGLVLVLSIFINYFINYVKISKPHPWILIILASIISNLQESSLLRPGQTLNFMFIFSYLLLFVNFYKSFLWSSRSENQ